MAEWRLAVDFGTTFTAVAVAVGGRAQLVDVEGDGDLRLPSAVWLDDAGELVVGTAAIRQAVFAPERFEPTPKRAMGSGRVRLGARALAVAEVVAAVLERSAVAARSVGGGGEPAAVWLTHPADWAQTRLGELRQAARVAGLGEVGLVAEPVAAAAHIAGARLRVGEHVAIYDFGGGTFDAAVVRRTQSGFEVAGPPAGRDPLGGQDIDQRILDHLGSGPLGAEDDWPRLMAPSDARWRRHAADLRLEVRRAKEALSTSVAYRMWVPGIERDVQLTRAELEQLIEPIVQDTVGTLQSTIEAAGVEAQQLAGIYLVGGSSRIPLVADTIWRRLGRRPDLQDDPKSVVALGAATWTDQPAASASQAGASAPTRPSPPPPQDAPPPPPRPRQPPKPPPRAPEPEPRPTPARSPTPAGRSRAKSLAWLVGVIAVLGAGALALLAGGGGEERVSDGQSRSAGSARGSDGREEGSRKQRAGRRTGGGSSPSKEGVASPSKDRVVTESTFRSPSGNIGCFITPADVRCDIRDRDWEPPAPPADCELDFGQGIALSAGGEAAFVCAGDTVLDDSATKLHYGEAISSGTLRCKSARSGMRCEDSTSGNGFLIAVERYEL